MSCKDGVKNDSMSKDGMKKWLAPKGSQEWLRHPLKLLLLNRPSLTACPRRRLPDKLLHRTWNTIRMARRSGSAILPLHGGRVPTWLATRMASLGAIITEAVIHHYGRDEFLQRLSHPFWFQSFGAVMGMDWHSSGITTSVIGALKRGLGPLSGELGIHVCGGRGQHSGRRRMSCRPSPSGSVSTAPA